MRLILLASITLLLAACAPYTQNSSGGGSSDLPTCPSTIEISNFAFQPNACSVAAGTTIAFVNRDQAPHTATSLPEAAAAFDTGTLNQGQSASVTFDAAGNYPYFCQLHPSMTARIVVTE